MIEVQHWQIHQKQMRPFTNARFQQKQIRPFTTLADPSQTNSSQPDFMKGSFNYHLLQSSNDSIAH